MSVDPGVPNPPGVRADVRAGVRLVFCEKPEFRLCVMPEIIILVCSVVRVRPLLYKEEQSALRAKRSSRSFDTLATKKRGKKQMKSHTACQLYFLGSIFFLPLDQLICKGKLSVQ